MKTIPRNIEVLDAYRASNILGLPVGEAAQWLERHWVFSGYCSRTGEELFARSEEVAARVRGDMFATSD